MRTAPPSSPIGNPDIGGSRASMAMMVAEILGIPVERVRPIVADTSSIGFSFLTGGSRVTFATGMAATQAAEKVVEDLKQRAAMIWDIPPRRGRMEGWEGLPRRRQCRQLRADAARGDRAEGRSHRRADPGRGVDQCAGCRARLCDPHLRCRGRSRDRPRQDPALHRGSGCRPRDPPILCRGPDPGWRDPGDRLGARTKSTFTTKTGASRTRAFSTIACRWLRICR